MGKLSFLFKLLRKYLSGQSTACPHCGSSNTICLQRKKLLVQLRQCNDCSLMFRYPKDSEEDNKGFYQRNYKQETVTDLPAAADIPNHIATRFATVGRDLTEHLTTIRAFTPTGRLLDYGCSWGYCVYQFAQAGYQAFGFEISKPRVEYGKSTLNVDLTSNIDELPDASFDVIYSAHVLEHIPKPEISFRNFQRLLKPGGMLFIYVPNGGSAEAQKLGIHWGPMVGEKHVLALTAEFFNRNLPQWDFTVKFASSTYAEPPRTFDNNPALDGQELLVVAQRT